MCAFDHDYEEFIPLQHQYHGFENEVMKKFQQHLAMHHPLRRPATLILDGCFPQNNSNEFQWVMQEDVNLIVTLQYARQLPDHVRNSFDYILICENGMRSRQRLWANYGDVFPTFQLFSWMLDELTSNFGYMVIDNRVRSHRIEDVVKWFKPPRI